MSLAAKVSHEFAARIRFRGTQYFHDGAVTVLKHSPVKVEAVVQGSYEYSVRLAFNNGKFAVACTCPYFDEGEECKHIWATILEADEHNYLPAANQQKRLPLWLDFATADELSNGDATAPTRKASSSSPPRTITPRKPNNPPQAIQPRWQQQLQLLSSSVRGNVSFEHESWPLNRQVIYLIDPAASRKTGRLTLDIGYRQPTRKGDWSKFKQKRIPQSVIPMLKDQRDVQILSLLSGAEEYYYYSPYSLDSLFNHCSLSTESQKMLLPLMCATGRCCLRSEDGAELLPIEWDEDVQWELSLKLKLRESAEGYELESLLRHGEKEVKPASALVLIEGIVIGPDLHAARIASRGAHAWTLALKGLDGLPIPAKDVDELLERLLGLPNVPHLDLPPEFEYEQVQLSPTPQLLVRRPNETYSYANNNRLDADLLFQYGGMIINLFDSAAGVYDRGARRFVLRNSEAEQAAVELLSTLKFKEVTSFDNRRGFTLTPRNLPHAVKTLLDNGWKVEAEGKLYRQPGSMNMSVSSGIDWFELHGAVEFGEGLVAELPKLLSSLRRGESMIELGDGSFGLLPDDWLKKYGLLTSLGETADDHLRFKRTQTGILDALLAAQPEIKTDEIFDQVLKEWRDFKGIKPGSAPKSFVGTLRDYQNEALGWFAFLERFGFGGCLADDMGLGKTVQVLALLESRRVARQALSKLPASKRELAKVLNRFESGPGSSLVVVPRSLVFNWQQEAERFTPKLKVLSHTGAERTKGIAHFAAYDLVLTTYGTLRRDALDFHEAQFDYVILDESQAIKNAKTESAKAVRLLRARNRLALSGTPIENHLGELWSLFEFLNPGMLGGASVFQLTTNNKTPNDETRLMLARAVRPFMLRRTKEQVAKELPKKLEQTIYCEMEPTQQKQYDELRDHYRRSLLDRVEQTGIKRSKIQILEALLRLRQAACHPALLSKDQEEAPSAKLDVLLPRLSEVIAEGHKALVFSQFTSFLAIVRRRLEREGIVYEYLDGKTRDRGARVARFQEDTQCKLFLISLKAGGQGLNLTAADYVFLLDPWWNPAVEAQAIDRAHRIGQSKRVFAYRLITRETVEEKVLALQATKRELADAIINEDNSLIRNITGEELLLLLS